MKALATEMDLFKKARRHITKLQDGVKAAEKLPMGDQKRLLLLDQAASDARGFAKQLENVVLAERQHETRGWSAYNVSMLDDSAEPILVG